MLSSTFLSEHWLDITTTILGLLYILLEYRASIWLWAVGILMPAMDTALYWQHGLYGDSALAVYYTLAAVYGLAVWKMSEARTSGHPEARKPGHPKTRKSENPSHMPLRLYPYASAAFLLAWGTTYWVLAEYTNSTVPTLDGFTNAMSIIGMWALARKFVEQWVFWIIVDVVCTYLYIIKGIPFKAGLYGLYVLIAIAGYRKWSKLAASN